LSYGRLSAARRRTGRG